jgi:hypothetical protein
VLVAPSAPRNVKLVTCTSPNGSNPSPSPSNAPAPGAFTQTLYAWITSCSEVVGIGASPYAAVTSAEGYFEQLAAETADTEDPTSPELGEGFVVRLQTPCGVGHHIVSLFMLDGGEAPAPRVKALEDGVLALLDVPPPEPEPESAPDPEQSDEDREMQAALTRALVILSTLAQRREPGFRTACAAIESYATPEILAMVAA